MARIKHFKTQKASGILPGVTCGLRLSLSHLLGCRRRRRGPSALFDIGYRPARAIPEGETKCHDPSRSALSWCSEAWP